jgi:hypothetical protein
MILRKYLIPEPLALAFHRKSFGMYSQSHRYMRNPARSHHISPLNLLKRSPNTFHPTESTRRQALTFIIFPIIIGFQLALLLIRLAPVNSTDKETNGLTSPLRYVTSVVCTMDSSAFEISTIAEAALVIVNLVLFSYGYPDASRTALWEEGGSQEFNSDPSLRIYFYANYSEPPEIPFIWSQTWVK